MKEKIFTTYLSLCCICGTIAAQDTLLLMPYEPSTLHPYGLPNPEAPPETADFAEMIGTCDCKSISRNPDGSWADTVDMVWRWQYIMNGYGVQDQVWRPGDQHAGSIRQFDPDSGIWVVSYYSTAGIYHELPSWKGERHQDSIVLNRDFAQGGQAGSSRLTFYNLSRDGFDWKGVWHSKDGNTSYPFWNIYCKKRREE